MPRTKWGERRALAKLDLVPIWKILVMQRGWDQVRAGLAETAYRRHLQEFIDHPDAMSVSVEADVYAFWREHAATNEKYENDCMAVFERPDLPGTIRQAAPRSWDRPATPPAPRPSVSARPAARRPLPVVPTAAPNSPVSPPPADDGINPMLAVVAATVILDDGPSHSSPPAESPSYDSGGSSGSSSYDSGGSSYGGSSYGGDSGGGSYDSGGGGSSCGGSSCGGGGGD